jgi:DNA-directed RNA polymerase I, II, and III subunit RPABC4
MNPSKVIKRNNRLPHVVNETVNPKSMESSIAKKERPSGPSADHPSRPIDKLRARPLWQNRLTALKNISDSLPPPPSTLHHHHFPLRPPPNHSTTPHTPPKTSSPKMASYAPPATTQAQPVVSDSARSVEYTCGDCDAAVSLKRGEPIRCRSCGHRVLYKQRTNR